MKCKEILEIIDGNDFFELGGQQLIAVEDHCASCGPCRRAASAARAASAMLAARAQSVEDPAPSAFFSAKVMNAIRSKVPTRSTGEAFMRWWQASNSLVSIMVVLVLFLVAGAALAPKEEEEAVIAVPSNLYPTETVIIDHKPSRELNEEQVFRVIYNTRYEVRK